ncbi:MAG: hypothetical protein NT007_04475 [Candidatus Kapabacteria bacterium]|nr:hypothetical protein [Candidatus Kapabacteria bacterium]
MIEKVCKSMQMALEGRTAAELACIIDYAKLCKFNYVFMQIALEGRTAAVVACISNYETK